MQAINQAFSLLHKLKAIIVVDSDSAVPRERAREREGEGEIGRKKIMNC
jgi:hypothetical protein